MIKTHTPFISLLFIFLFFFNLATSVRAENDLKFNHLTVIDGLLHNSATCIAQDASGFIWIGTQRGLNRYDGYKIDSYFNKGDLRTTVFNNRVRRLQVRGDIMWVATLQGLLCFDIRKKEYVDYVDENNMGLNKRRVIHSLFIDSRNRIWVGVNGMMECALVIKNKNGLTLKNINIDNASNIPFPNKTTPELVELTNGTNILLANGKLFEFREVDALHLKKKAIICPYVNIQRIHAVGNNMWLFFDNKAIVVSYSKGKLIQLDEIPYPSCSILTIQSSKESVWLITSLGILQIAKKPVANRIQFHVHSVLDPYSVCSDHQSAILVDNMNNLWVTTYAGGVSYTNIGKQKFELVKYMPFKSNKYLPGEFVYSIHEDSKGYIYVGTKLNGISRYNMQTKTFDYTINLQQKLGVNANVPSLQSDDNWVYALVTFQGSSVYRIHKISQKIELVKSYAPNTGFSFAFDNHNQLWVGLLGKGLSCLKMENGKVISDKLYSNQSDPVLNLSSNDVNYVYVDKQKNEVLVSTTNGLNRLMLNGKGDVDGVAYYLSDEKNTSSLSSNYVWPIDKENDSIYWVGTMGSGLNRIVIGKRETGVASYKAEYFGTESGAPSNDIESVQVDKFGYVWCGGRYLSRFDYKTKRFKTYYEEDGIQSYQFGTGTSCKARNGMLFFGGLKGMNYFMPDTTVERQQYKVVFSRLLIDGKVLYVGDTLNGKVVLKNDLQFLTEVKIPYPCNNLTIEFTSLTYSQKKNIQYRYKLEGFDKNWIYANGLIPFAMYPKLPYKSYTFAVEVNVDNQWLKAGNELEITIMPPWWQSAWAYLIYFVIIAILFYIAARYSLNWINLKRQITLQNEREKQKEELMELKTNFFTNISHEFKTPLTLINASVAEIETKYEQLFGDRYFQILKRNNSKLMHLISELMDFQRSNASLIELKATEIDVRKFVQEIVEEFQPFSERSGIKMYLTLPSEPVRAWVDEECLIKIISNVVSNSLRYTENEGEIQIIMTIGSLDNYTPKYANSIAFINEMQYGNQLIFTVTDTGIGISKESLPDIFERFHTIVSKTSKHLGSGIGLALVKSLVELHKGGVLISSEREVGTEFVFTIPLDDAYLAENQKIIEAQFDRELYFEDYKQQILEEDVEHDSENDESKPTLLIVDDNKDLLLLLLDHFKAEFNILLAEDGEAGMEQCNERFPDLIISDVMMPKMTGLELCNRLRSQMKTCFIPIVLLTARGTTEQQIEGIDEGADAYISKPFHLGLLHATVISLLNKSKLTNRSINVGDTESSVPKFTRKIALDNENQFFIDKMTKIVLNNIEDSDYSIDALCLEIGASRSRLYTQVKNITNETLGDFIKEIRLEKGAELLRTTGLTVSEVSSRIGIDSPSFFTRLFKQRFGMPPSEYIKKHTSI